MIKNKLKPLLGALILTMAAPAVSANVYWDALKGLYDNFFGKTDWLVIGVIDETPTIPEWYRNHYYETNDFVESGKLGYEPYRPGIYGIQQSWSQRHFETCTALPAFREMPITGTPDGYVDLWGYNGPTSVKEFIVQQNVPAVFSAKTHGGLTDLLSDSFYFFSFGDGIRQYNKKGDHESAEHTYHVLGQYLLSSLVYTEEWSIFIGISSSFYGDLSINDNSLAFDLEKNGDLYLEGCDVAQVKVVPNNAPNARIHETYRSSSMYTTSVSFSGGSSSDPDGNPLTYTWRYGNQTKTGRTTGFSFATPDVGEMPRSYTVSLTVTDGDKSDTSTRTVYVSQYCYSCNGVEIP